MKNLIFTIVVFLILIPQDINMQNARAHDVCTCFQSYTSGYSVNSCSLTDSVSFELLNGCWGTDSETGNSIFCFTSPDSVLWVDPLLWCKYEIIRDSIIMMVDDLLYYQGHIKCRPDTVILEDETGLNCYPRHK